MALSHPTVCEPPEEQDDGVLIPSIVALTLDLPLSGSHQLSVDINCKQRPECKAKGVDQLICVPLYPLGFPCGSAGKESACNVGDLGSIPELGRSPGEQNSYPLQYSGLENSMDYTVSGVANSRTQLAFTCIHMLLLSCFSRV